MLKYCLLVLLFIMPGYGLATPAILVLGDSLSANYGFNQSEGWVSLLNKRLAKEGYSHRMVNASISGETTKGALTRVQQELQRSQPAICIIELGGNDGLRGLSLTDMKKNLAAMIEACQRGQAAVLLVGMKLPPNYGRSYTQAFERIYKELAEQYRIRYVPFLLAGLEATRNYFQADGIHPTAAAQPLIMENVWKHLQPLLNS